MSVRAADFELLILKMQGQGHSMSRSYEVKLKKMLSSVYFECFYNLCVTCMASFLLKGVLALFFILM